MLIYIMTLLGGVLGIGTSIVMWMVILSNIIRGVSALELVLSAFLSGLVSLFFQLSITLVHSALSDLFE